MESAGPLWVGRVSSTLFLRSLSEEEQNLASQPFHRAPAPVEQARTESLPMDSAALPSLPAGSTPSASLATTGNIPSACLHLGSAQVRLPLLASLLAEAEPPSGGSLLPLHLPSICRALDCKSLPVREAVQALKR